MIIPKTVKTSPYQVIPVGAPIVFDVLGNPWVYLADRGRMVVLKENGEPSEDGFYAFNLEEGINQMINSGFLENDHVSV